LSEFLSAFDVLAEASGNYEQYVNDVVIAFGSAIESINFDPVTAAAEALATENITLADQYYQASDAVREWIAASDGSLQSLYNSAQGLLAMKQAAIQTAGNYRRVKRRRSVLHPINVNL